MKSENVSEKGLTKLSDLVDNFEFWRGVRIRLVNDGKNLHPDDKYFDYILAAPPWDREAMMLVNITEGSHKAGAVYATKIEIDKSSGKAIVTKMDLKKALGPDFKNCYLLN